MQDFGRLDDTELLRTVAGGDEGALGELYDRFHRPCYAFALRMLGAEADAEEAVQEAFVRAWRNAHLYDNAKAGGQTWLISITRNLCIDELRRRRRRAAEATTLDDVAEPPDPGRTDVEAERAMLRTQVRRALELLPGEQRSAIELVYFHGLTSQEVGRVLKVPAPTVRSRLRLGLLKLGGTLREQGVTSLG
ncbi:MAG: RNA polymerase sigma factor [Dehalococcoidia bacterium]|nr:RNA polymerase sigma factor [Dehalococcoidia bacterium]